MVLGEFDCEFHDECCCTMYSKNRIVTTPSSKESRKPMSSSNAQNRKHNTKSTRYKALLSSVAQGKMQWDDVQQEDEICHKFPTLMEKKLGNHHSERTASGKLRAQNYYPNRKIEKLELAGIFKTFHATLEHFSSLGTEYDHRPTHPHHISCVPPS